MALPPDQVFYVTPAEINGWRAAGNAVIVDVREPDEWAEAHIPGAILMPLSQFDPAAIPDPHGKHLVFHCRSGRRCGLAAEKAVAAGYAGVIKRMQGGFLAWDAAGYDSNRAEIRKDLPLNAPANTLKPDTPKPDTTELDTSKLDTSKLDTTKLDTTKRGRGQEANRLFLVVVDQSEEFTVAIRYACDRARRTGGRVALLYVYNVEKDFHHWKFVSRLADNEARAEAENILKLHALRVVQETGRMPDTYIREGDRRAEVFALIKEHPEISMLVLSAAPGTKPGPLVAAVTGKYAGKIGIPVTIVPTAGHARTAAA